MSPWLGDFHFLRPAWLALIPVCLAVVWLLRRPRGNLSQWRRWCDPPLLAYLTFGDGGRHRRWPLVLLSLCWLLAILSLAGPVWEQRPQPLYRSEAARVIVFDLSRSMLATDLKPNRLTQARFKLADLLDATAEGQVALVAYAGEAFVVSPLTQDARTIKAMLGALEPSVMPVQGSDLGEALQLALVLLQRVAAVAGDVILFTDSPGVGAAEAVARLRAAGHRLSVIGIGTPEGAPIPDARGGFVKAADGSIAVPRLDEPALAALAAQGGGSYFRLRADARDVRLLTEARPAVDRSTGEALSQESLQWYERGPWLVVLLLPLAAAAFRRGWLGCVALLALMPPESQALPSWDDLWRTPDQQAAAALEAGDPATAAQRARDPMLRGEALYRQGDYAAAQQAFARSQGADSHYNRGNALARQQRYQQAIEAYDEALSLEPDMEDAAYNKKLIEDLLKQQQQQEQQRQQPQDGDGTEQEQSESQESESSESESEQQQAQEGAPEDQQQEQQQERQKPAPAEAEELDAEQRQALEQWLRRIPDDPGGLLRRKFLLEYQRRGSPPPATEEEW